MADVKLRTNAACAGFPDGLLGEVVQAGGLFRFPYFLEALCPNISDYEFRIPVQLLADGDLAVREHIKQIDVPGATCACEESFGLLLHMGAIFIFVLWRLVADFTSVIVKFGQLVDSGFNLLPLLGVGPEVKESLLAFVQAVLRWCNAYCADVLVACEMPDQPLHLFRPVIVPGDDGLDLNLDPMFFQKLQCLSHLFLIGFGDLQHSAHQGGVPTVD